MMAAFALIGAVITGQELIFDDGTQLAIQLERPPRVIALMRNDGENIDIVSLHRTKEEALSRLEAEEALAERGASKEPLQ